jgi:hypothetical protein
MGRLTDILTDILTGNGSKPSHKSHDETPPSAPSPSNTPINEPWPGLKEGEEDKELSDCFSCKVVGTTTMTVTSTYVYYYTLKHARKHTGLKRIGMYGQGLSLGTLLLLLAVSRAFDAGPFDQTKQDKKLTDRAAAEFKDLAHRIGYSKAKTNDS